MSRYLSETPIDQLWRQLGVKFYSMWCYIWPGVSILARKKWLTLNFHALLGYHYYFLSVTWSWFYVSGMSESQNITPTGLCHGPPRPLATFGIMHMFHAHIISVPSALPMSFFFSVLTPAQWGKTDPAGHQLKDFSVSGRISNLCQISSLWESVILPNL